MADASRFQHDVVRRARYAAGQGHAGTEETGGRSLAVTAPPVPVVVPDPYHAEMQAILVPVLGHDVEQVAGADEQPGVGVSVGRDGAPEQVRDPRSLESSVPVAYGGPPPARN